MAACDFTRSFSGSASDLVARARRAITGAGGTLDGDATRGTFRIPSPVGNIEGAYAVAGATIRFEVTRKPFLVSCGTIEARVDEFLATPAAPRPLATALSVNGRTLSISGSLFVLDHESFGANETDTLPLNATVALNPDVPSQSVLSVAKGVGGEVRAEVKANAVLLANGAVNVDGRTLLFEGTSEATDDLDGTLAFSFVVPAGSRVENEYRVDNTDEGGDYAIVRLVAVNLP